MSDFSIDYILNRAGNRYRGTNSSMGILQSYKYEYLPSNHIDHEIHIERINNLTCKSKEPSDPYEEIKFEQQSGKHENFHIINTIPMFDWLQYTRYHPPKIPRSLRQGSCNKRTPGRLPRIPFTTGQLHKLETAYRHSNYLSAEEANQLALGLNLSSTRVKIWFQNRRARERRNRRMKQTNPDTNLSTLSYTILSSPASSISINSTPEPNV